MEKFDKNMNNSKNLLLFQNYLISSGYFLHEETASQPFIMIKILDNIISNFPERKTHVFFARNDRKLCY